jgi:competence protein ComEC
MRAVALSALVILAVEPESVIEPSFQMSFAAIVGLIALAEWQRGRARSTVPADGWMTRLFRWLWRYVAGLLLVSVVAGLATAPFAIFHFDRAPGYSLLANLLAMPVVSIVIMPAACATVAAMPLGLEYWPLQVMGWGVNAMTAIAQWVAALPGAVNLVQAWSPAVLILIAFGGLWTGLWQRRWRWLGLVSIATGLLLSLTEQRPDILIARDGASAAVRGRSGLILLGKPDDYTAAQWLLRDGDARDPKNAREGARCDEWGCIATERGGHIVSLALRAGALPDDCGKADVLLAAVPVRVPCTHPLRVVDRFAVLDRGAIALWFGGGTVREISVAAERGRRPWSVAREDSDQ